MNISQQAQRRIGRFAWAMAWVGLVVGQLHALARFATADGKEDLDLPWTAAWAVPAAEVFEPLLSWASADAVYLTYGKVWLPVFAAFTLCAFVVHARRRPAGFERWAWRFALFAYGWACVAVALEYWTQWASPNAFFELAFLLSLPAVLLTLLSSTVLGIVLLRKGMRPRVSAVLLALTIPLVVLILSVTSMGNAALPIVFAWGIIGRRLATEIETEVTGRDRRKPTTEVGADDRAGRARP